MIASTPQKFWLFCLFTIAFVACDGESTADSGTECRSSENACDTGFECSLQGDGRYQCVARSTDLDTGVDQPTNVDVSITDAQAVADERTIDLGTQPDSISDAGLPDFAGLDVTVQEPSPNDAATDMALNSDRGLPNVSGQDAMVQTPFPIGVSQDVQLERHAGRVFDVFMPSRVPRQVVIFLHGGGGSKEGSANHLGLNDLDQAALDETQTAWLLPQGANANVSGVRTWSNYVMDSGYEGPDGAGDVGFLSDLSQWARSRLGVDNVVLGGHSNGGMMTHRMWCEADNFFDRFISVAGPPSVDFSPNGASRRPCMGSKPYWAILGTQDRVLQNQDLEAEVWTIAQRLQDAAFVNPNLFNEVLAQASLRVALACPDNTDITEREEGPRLLKTGCNDRMRVWLIRPPEDTRLGLLGQHPIETLEAHGAFILRDLIVGWE